MLSTSTIRYTLENRHGEAETFQTLEEIPNIEITDETVELTFGGNDPDEIFIAPIIKGYNAPYVDESTDEIGTEHYIYYEENTNKTKVVRNFELYNDHFKALLIEKFPDTQIWLDTIAKEPIDIHSLLEIIGFKIVPTDLGTEAYSKRIGNVIYTNSNVTEAARRYDMGLIISRLLLDEEVAPKIRIKTTTSNIVALPKEVTEFLINIGFESRTKNSLRNAITALTTYTKAISDETDPIVVWYATEDADKDLALAYLHDFK